MPVIGDCWEGTWILFVTVSHFTIILNPRIPLGWGRAEVLPGAPLGRARGCERLVCERPAARGEALGSGAHEARGPARLRGL